MARWILLGLFFVLFMDSMLGLDLSLALGLSVKNVFLYLLLLFLLMRAALTKRLGVTEFRQVHVAFFLLVVVGIVSWYFTRSINLLGVPYDALASAISLKNGLVDHYLFFLVFLYGVTSGGEALWVAKRMLALVALSNVVTVIDVFDIPDLGIIHEREDGRVSGPLGESNQYGAFLVLMFPGMVAMMMTAPTAVTRALWAGGALVSFAVLLLTTSRGAFVGLAGGLLIGGFYLRHHIPTGVAIRRALAAAVVVGLTVMALGVHYSDLLYERLIQQTTSDDIREVSSGRSANWTAALTKMTEYPTTFVHGFGWATYRLALTGRPSHNSYLSFLYELGAIGLVLFLLVVTAVIREARRGIDRNPEGRKTEVIAFVIGFIALLGAVFFVNLYTPWFFVWAYVGLMLRIAAEAPEQAAVPAPATTAAPAPAGPTPVSAAAFLKTPQRHAPW